MLKQLGAFSFPRETYPTDDFECLRWQAVPVQGDGMDICDWLFVEDHARALYKVVTESEIGETYNIATHNEKANRSNSFLSQVLAGQGAL